MELYDKLVEELEFVDMNIDKLYDDIIILNQKQYKSKIIKVRGELVDAAIINTIRNNREISKIKESIESLKLHKNDIIKQWEL